MGLQDKFKKVGGGFLNNAAVQVVDLNWVVGDTYAIKEGKNKGGDFAALNLVGQFQQDTLPAPTTVKMLVGNAANMVFEISDDGKDIEFSKGGVYPNSVAGVFLNSCEKPREGSLSISDFGDEDNKNLLSVAGIIGARMTVDRIVNNDRKAEKDQNGKLWPARDLTCIEILALPEGAEVAVEDDDVSPSDAAKIAVLRYLESAPANVLPVTKLKAKVQMDPSLAGNPALPIIVKLVEDVTFLKSVEEAIYDGKAKTLALREAA